MNTGYLNSLKRKLEKHNGIDPQDKLDDETVKDYLSQIEKLESILEDIEDAKRKEKL